MTLNKAVFFDRDGILINAIVKDKKPYSIKNLKSVVIKKNIKKIINTIKKKKYLIFMITNQPDVTRRLTKKKNVIKINLYLKKELKLDDIFVCYASNNNCYRKKPNPGMIYDAKKKWKVNLKKSYLIGDRWKDIEAGNRAGVVTIYKDCNYDEKKPRKYSYIIKKLGEIEYLIKN
jgi:D-glycero-D-manno-heptose 1,7-bisphosphate phosphatase